MAQAKQYFNRIPNCKVIHPDGRIITFYNFKHISTVKIDQDYLDELIQEPGSFVYIKEDEYEIDTDDFTEEGRIRKIKKEGIKEFLAQQERAAQMSSSSSSEGLKAATTADVTPAKASNSAPEAAPASSAAPAKINVVTGAAKE